METFDSFMMKVLQAMATEEVKKSTNRERQIFRQISLSRLGRIKEQTNGDDWDTIWYPTFMKYQPSGPVELVPTNQIPIKEIVHVIMKPFLGKYLLCRTITEPIRTRSNAIQVVVEDWTGDQEHPTIRINLYNWCLDEEFDPRILPPGTTLILKNPWPAVFELGVGIRIDNPDDVEINNEFYTGWGPLNLTINRRLGEKSPEPVSDFKEKGNAYFLQGKLHSAIRNYSFGIENDPLNALLLTNRAACYLKTGRPLEALKDSERALGLDPVNPKAIWRKAVALSRLNKLENAIEFLKSNEPTVKNNSDITTLLDELEKLLFEYNNPHLHQPELPKICANYLNQMDFTGPVKIMPISGKGRGLIATRNVKEFELLLAFRAFDILTEDYDHEVIINNNHRAQMIRKFLASVVQRLKEHPELRAQFYQLHSGPASENSITTLLCDSKPKATHPQGDPLDPTKISDSDPDLQASLLLDINKVANIVAINAHGPETYHIQDNKKTQRLQMGLHIFQSFINHTCVNPNAIADPNGDFSLVWATKDISAGQEILISYFDVTGMTYKDREERIKNKLHFTCNCPLCIKQRRRAR